MRKKSLNFIVELVVYPFDVMVSIGETDEEVKRKLKKYDVQWDESLTMHGIGKFLINKENKSLIRLKHYPQLPMDYGTLQHEIFHAVTWILDRCGMKFKLGTSDEAYSYLVGYLTKEIYKRI